MSATWGITSRTGSVTNFSGEPRGGLLRCFDKRGELDELLGESGGVLAAGNTEGKVLLPAAFKLLKLPTALRGVPAFASSIKDLTCHTIPFQTTIEGHKDINGNSICLC